MKYVCIVRAGQLQFLSSSPPVNCNVAVIYLKDGSKYSRQAKRLVDGRAQVETLEPGDQRRVPDNAPSTPRQPIFDIKQVGKATWQISSHNNKYVVSPNMTANISGR